MHLDSEGQPSIARVEPEAADRSAGVVSRSCVIVGSGSLAVRCAERLREAGHGLRAVLAADSTLAGWARLQGVPQLDSAEKLTALLSRERVNWLFSVANPLVLPAMVLDRAEEAINCHDGPLPRYAGVHATSWALLAGETEHAVTWHRMTAAVGTGAIMVQRPVTVAADDTALTLNQKCHQAAEEGFAELLARLEAGTLVPRPQELAQRSYFGRRRRPEAGGCLRWNRTAAELSAMVRALEFGLYQPNPVGVAKIRLSGRVVRVGRLEVLPTRSAAPAGTLLEIGAEHWRVATASTDVVVRDLSGLAGEPARAGDLARELGLSAGDGLPMLSQQASLFLQEAHEAAVEREEIWLRRLERHSSRPFPFARPAAGEVQWRATPWQKLDGLAGLIPAKRVEHLLAVWAVYLARITGETELQLGWATEPPPPLLEGMVAAVVPLDVEVGLNRRFAEVRAEVMEACGRVTAAGHYARELIVRYPQLRRIDALRRLRPWDVAVGVVHDEQAARRAGHEVLGGVVTLQIRAQDGAVRWFHDTARLTPEQVDRMTGHLLELAQAALRPAAQEMPVRSLNMLPAEERTLLLDTWNRTEAAYPSERCIHELFEEQALRTPSAVAVEQGEVRLSYGELNARANRLAHRLIGLGVRPDDRVALCVERSPAMVVGLLAVLKAGGAYVPLDPGYPRERLGWLLGDAAPRLVLADGVGRTALGEALSGREVIALDDPLEGLPATDPEVPGLTSRQLAYVIYTSGSTGTPKGVMVEHRGLVNLVAWHIKSFGLEAGSRSAVTAGVSFDASAWEIWPTLSSGGVLLVPPGAAVGDAGALLEWWQRQALDTSFLSTPLARMALADGRVSGRLRHLLIGGDHLPQVPSTLPSGLVLVNNYGPTESTVVATSGVLAAGGPSHIGRPIANTWIYVLDGSGGLVPVGVAGELWIGGAGVARGYLNRAELTAERFIRDPYGADPEARVYRTGDLVRWLADGTLEYLGRIDDQVKIRGYRIEPGEVSARLLEHALVREAVVVARGEGADRHLVAYVVPSERTGRDPEREIRQVVEWQTVYNEEYGKSRGSSFGEDFRGWISSYDGQPIPGDEMREWRAETIARILELKPRRVLEIGVGSGLILSQLAPDCEEYWGTDLSGETIETLEAQLGSTPELAGRVILRCQPADMTVGLPVGGFDTIVINSVVQYFPSAGYTIEVLRRALDLLSSGGSIFIGDVRNLGLLRCFATAVQLARSGDGGDLASLRASIERRLATEKEILFDPGFFVALRHTLNGIAGVDIRVKRGRASNELSRYRYDVVLRKEPAEVFSAAALPQLHWGRQVADLASLAVHLETHRAAGVRLRNVPNAHLAREVAALEQLQAGEPLEAVYRALRRDQQLPGLEDFQDLGVKFGMRVVSTWSGGAGTGDLDIVFLTQGTGPLDDIYCPDDTGRGITALASDPARLENANQLASALRSHLGGVLPDYMVPAAYVVLDALPLTANGKLDRRALPEPGDEAYARGAYEAPEGEAEMALAQLWAELLGVERVGRRDSFFELGGHSLLAVRLLSRTPDAGLNLTMDDLFRNPLLQDLARKSGGSPVGQDHRKAIPVQRAGRESPIFFVPTGRGDHSYVFELARELDVGLPVYALPWPPAHEPQPRTLEAMAVRMLAMIRAVQPHGPYRLAGYSSGGMLAYAIAHQLLGCDETVSFIGLIDVLLPTDRAVDPQSAKDMLLDWFEEVDLPDRARQLATLHDRAGDLSLPQLIQEGQRLGILAAHLDAHAEAMAWEQRQHFEKLVRSYRMPPLSMPVHQFNALRIMQAADAELHWSVARWQDVLPASILRPHPIPGDHWTMMTEPENRTVLGQRISEALRTPASTPSPAKPLFDPLISLDITGGSGIPLLCVPGAGASVTSFNELVVAFGQSWPIYGLQPRGIDPAEQPHSSVEAAALCNLRAASSLTAAGPVHLLGHSHGGLVAYEMACRLLAQGRPVASLTIIDSEPPEISTGIIRDVTETEIFEKFVDAIRLTFERPLPLDHDVLAVGQAEARLRHLHGAMIHAGILPARSVPEMLRGPLSAFAAALRSAYHPVAPYAGRLRLVQVDDPKLDPAAHRQRQRHAEEWRRWASEPEIWRGPGHHYSILRDPHVRVLADWWLGTGA